MDPRELDREVRDELRSLNRPVAERVGRHLVMAGRLLDDDPDTALAHAVAARRLASRVPVVREAAGIAAYQAGQWQAAAAELRTYHRMSGRHTHLAILADCERALGRPERAIDIYRSAPTDQLTGEEAVELLIVAAGARTDQGRPDQAVTMLQVPQLTTEGPGTARLRYAYAEALLAAGEQPARAREWLARAVDADPDGVTGAAERLLELEGVTVAEEAGADVGTGAAPAARLADAYDLLVLDLDGVVYRGAEPVPGAVAAIQRLRQGGPPLVFVTNNASRSADDVASFLSGMDIPASPADILTSAMAAADRLAEQFAPDTRVLVVGAPALVEEVRRVGLRPVSGAAESPAAVVQGYSPQVGWAELAEACVAIRAGARWVVTNTDTTLPSERGPLPGNGSLVAALRTALDREPDEVVGKPQPALFRAVAARTGARRPLVVGDRLDTDIEGAHRAGMHSLLVRTGVDRDTEVEGLPARRRPTYLGGDLARLLEPPGDGPRTGVSEQLA